MLRRVLRYSSPMISIKKSMYLLGAGRDAARSVLPKEVQGFKISCSCKESFSLIQISSPPLWLGDLDSRTEFHQKLVNVCNKLLSIAESNDCSLHFGYYRPSQQKEVEIDLLCGADEFTLHYEDRREQERFLNESSSYVPVMIARFGRALLDSTELQRQISYRYAKGYVQQGLYWASTSPQHIARVQRMFSAEREANELESLEMYPSQDELFRPTVEFKVIDSQLFLSSFKEGLLLILALATQNCRHYKNNLNGKVIQQSKVNLHYQKATAEGLSAKLNDDPNQSFRLRYLQLIENLKKEFLALEASTEEVAALYVPLAMRILQPKKAIPNTDTELLRYYSKEKSLSLEVTQQELISSRAFINQSNIDISKAIDRSLFESIRGDIEQWMKNESTDLVGPIRKTLSTKKNEENASRSSQKALLSDLNQSASAKKLVSEMHATYKQESKMIPDSSNTQPLLRLKRAIAKESKLLTIRKLSELLLHVKELSDSFGYEMNELRKNEDKFPIYFRSLFQKLPIQQFTTSIDEGFDLSNKVQNAIKSASKDGLALLVVSFPNSNHETIKGLGQEFKKQFLAQHTAYTYTRFQNSDGAGMSYQFILIGVEGRQV